MCSAHTHLAVALDPGRGVDGIQGERLAVHGHLLVDLVGDDADVIAQHAGGDVAELEVLNGPPRLFLVVHHLHGALVEARDPLGARDDAWVVGQLQGLFIVAVLERLPVGGFEPDQFLLAVVGIPSCRVLRCGGDPRDVGTRPAWGKPPKGARRGGVGRARPAPSKRVVLRAGARYIRVRAPFVYRKGHQVFNLERRVRLP